MPNADMLQSYFQEWREKCFPAPMLEEQARCIEVAFYAGVAGSCNVLRTGGTHADLQRMLATHIKRFVS